MAQRRSLNLTMLRRPQAQAKCRHSRSTFYQRIAEGLWPKPVRLGARAVGWPEHEVELLIAARIASKSVDEIRALVVKLEADRRTVVDRTLTTDSDALF